MDSHPTGVILPISCWRKMASLLRPLVKHGIFPMFGMDASRLEAVKSGIMLRDRANDDNIPGPCNRDRVCPWKHSHQRTVNLLMVISHRETRNHPRESGNGIELQTPRVQCVEASTAEAKWFSPERVFIQATGRYLIRQHD